MICQIKHTQSGFIALMSVSIISVLLIAITFSVSTTGFFARFNILNAEYKNISSNLAEGCVDTALLNLINDPSYNPTNEIVSVGIHTCTIKSVTVSGSQKIITTQALYPQTGVGRSYTNFKITITQSPTTLVINDWQEVTNL